MMADMVIVFMNSARKNRAKRIDAVLGVEAADQLLLGLDQVERRPVELGGGRRCRKMTNGTTPVTMRFQLRTSRRAVAGLAPRCRGCESVPVMSTTATTDRPRAAS